MELIAEGAAWLISVLWTERTVLWRLVAVLLFVGVAALLLFAYA